MTKSLVHMHNFGPKTAARLAAIGVADEAALRRIGAVGAYLRLKHRFPRETSLNALYALFGALGGRPWQDVRQEARQALAEALAAKARRCPPHPAGRAARRRRHRIRATAARHPPLREPSNRHRADIH